MYTLTVHNIEIAPEAMEDERASQRTRSYFEKETSEDTIKKDRENYLVSLRQKSRKKQFRNKRECLREEEDKDEGAL